MSINITVKSVTVENRGPNDLTIQPPGGVQPVVLSINKSSVFVVEGEYTGRFPNANFNAFTFEYKDGNLTITKGRVTEAAAANVTISATLT
ncbi:hypothetical protein CCMSSC00406_0007969 [Pleurotus cornucopiae]|uniref:Uncharacterized protein n=1 Tax=Pleurotus cornucopiae TaxID=5321 RepID=A0ACB7IL70_PLECO|nr:hypothetical protein CCMSSC00406_0007969 [Pleurotus cornucopiae]